MLPRIVVLKHLWCSAVCCEGTVPAFSLQDNLKPNSSHCLLIALGLQLFSTSADFFFSIFRNFSESFFIEHL